MNFKLPFNWFDVLILIVVFVGIQRGRKHGISEELLKMLKWLSIAIGCALIYQPIGKMIAEGPAFSLLSGYLMAYTGVALLIAALFAIIKKVSGGKLISSESFGGSEFYLGMAAGVVRFCCILVAAIALLNARYYSQAEIKEDLKFQNDVYGSNFFPTLYDIQAQVFEKSLAGPWIKQQLAILLIKPTPPEQKRLKQKEFAVPRCADAGRRYRNHLPCPAFSPPIFSSRSVPPAT
jgi:uncharacterized membrane protein required for colicin V production